MSGFGSGDFINGMIWQDAFSVGQDAFSDNPNSAVSFHKYNALVDDYNFVHNKALILTDELTQRGADAITREYQVQFLLQKLELSGASMDSIYVALNSIFDDEQSRRTKHWDDAKQAHKEGRIIPPSLPKPDLPIK